MESLPSFSENSMLVLGFSTKSSQTVAPSSPQTSQKNSDASSDMKSPYPQHTTLKPMEMERLNQEVETYLHIFCGSHPDAWANHIPMAEFVHNHRPHSTTGKSPFYLMLGYELQAIPSIIKTAHLPALEDHLRNLDTSRKEALAAHKLAQQLMRNQIKSKFTPFEVNNKVWLEARNLK